MQREVEVAYRTFWRLRDFLGHSYIWATRAILRTLDALENVRGLHHRIFSKIENYKNKSNAINKRRIKNNFNLMIFFALKFYLYTYLKIN